MRACTRTSVLDQELPALAPPGRKLTPIVTPQLTVAKRQGARLGRKNKKEKVGFSLPDKRVRVSGCMGARVCVNESACAHRRRECSDGQNGGGDTTLEQTNKGTREGTVIWLRTRRGRQRHYTAQEWQRIGGDEIRRSCPRPRYRKRRMQRCAATVGPAPPHVRLRSSRRRRRRSLERLLLNLFPPSSSLLACSGEDEG